MNDGWDESATAWIAALGDSGDFARQFVLDAPMLARVDSGVFANALDVGCGEGRFCRLLRARGIAATGIDPTTVLIDAARARDPGGDYRVARAEGLPFPDASFDLVVSYLSLIDIAFSSFPGCHPPVVIPGLDPGIGPQLMNRTQTYLIPGSSPGMTVLDVIPRNLETP